MLETNEYFFGTVKLGEKKTKEFKFQNTSGQTLTIMNVYNGGCNCVTSTIDKTILAPSESATLTVTIEPGSVGLFRREPQVKYKTDSFGPITDTLTVKAQVTS